MGATKVQASAVKACGTIVRRLRNTTPRGAGPQPIAEAIENSIRGILEKTETDIDQVVAIGVAIPGVVDPDIGHVVVTPNADLSDFPIGPYIEKKFKVPVAIGNDCNLGALGEKWLGSARHADSAMTIMVGTGVGGGFVQGAKLWRGARESACEIGHMVMQIDGPQCGCGNHGCLEAFASRTAIENNLRKAIADGRSSIITELTEGNLELIRSGMLRKALDCKDELVTEVIGEAAKIIGIACISVRHLLDPEVIVLGGGVIEACSDFIMPIIEQVVAADKLAGARPGGGILISSLGDDSVVLGAAALARMSVGENIFKERATVRPSYEKLLADGTIVRVGAKYYSRDFYVNVNGKSKAKKPQLTVAENGEIEITQDDLLAVCAGGPAVVFIGVESAKNCRLNPKAENYLAQRMIRAELLPPPKAIAAYNKAVGRRAILINIES